MQKKKLLCTAVAAAMLVTSLSACSKEVNYTADMAEYAYEDKAPSLFEVYADYFQVGAAVNPRDFEEGTERFEIIN